MPSEKTQLDSRISRISVQKPQWIGVNLLGGQLKLRYSSSTKERVSQSPFGFCRLSLLMAEANRGNKLEQAPRDHARGRRTRKEFRDDTKLCYLVSLATRCKDVRSFRLSTTNGPSYFGWSTARFFSRKGNCIETLSGTILNSSFLQKTITVRGNVNPNIGSRPWSVAHI